MSEIHRSLHKKPEDRRYTGPKFFILKPTERRGGERGGRGREEGRK